MKPTPQGPRRRAFLLFTFLILPLLVVAPPGATHATRQTYPDAAQDSPAAPGTLKLTVTVTGPKGGFITGLTKEDFSVWEGKTQREINYFSGEDLPASVAVLVDVSGSVRPSALASAKYAVTKFMERSHPANEYFVGEFNQERRELIGWTQNTQEILQGLDKLAVPAQAARPKPETRGQTALYDACAAALDAVAARPNPKHVLLLITDGMDNHSRLTFNRLSRKVKESDVLIYGISYSEWSDYTGLLIAGQAVLDQLTMDSGGRAYFPDNKKDLDEVIDRLAIELRHQYVVGFAPTNAARDGGWNKVKIKVARRGVSSKGVVARSREGYFSPSPKPAP